jgi:hypothetical protein
MDVTYRRKSDHAAATAWRQWIGANRSELERLGLPLAVYQDADHWHDFLENGRLDHHSDGPPFDFRDLPRGQQAQLCAFLERHHGGDDLPPALLRFLRVRLGDDHGR